MWRLPLRATLYSSCSSSSTTRTLLTTTSTLNKISQSLLSPCSSRSTHLSTLASRFNKDQQQEKKRGPNWKQYFQSGFAVTTGSWLAITVAKAEDERTDSPKKTALRERIITNYENRVRTLSSPERVFRYFASVKKGKEQFMTPEDFVRSLTPYIFPADGTPGAEYEWDEIKHTITIPAFFKYCDSNGDGLLSFGEYLFFVTLLSIPEREFGIAFRMLDEDSSGTIDQKEFLTLIDGLTHRSVMGQQQRQEPDPKSMVAGVLPHFFGSDGNGVLTFQQFSNFMKELQREVLKLEFQLYDKRNTGNISAHDFGTMLISYSKSHNLSEYLKRLDGIIDWKQSITFQEFVEFDQLLKNLEDMQVAIETYKGANFFTKQTFTKAAYAVSKVQLSPHVVDLVFALFDKDQDGKLDPTEFVEVMSRRAKRTLSSPRDFGFVRLVDCIKSCVN